MCAIASEVSGRSPSFRCHAAARPLLANPLQQPNSIQTGNRRDELDLPCEPARLERHFGRGIAEQVCIVETTFAKKSFGINRQPTLRPKIQNVGVMDVAVQHSNVTWSSQQLMSYAG